MKKLLVVLLALCVSGTLFAGGGGDKAFIGLAMPESHVQRWVKDGSSLKAEAEKRGYKAEVQ
jgi:putative multiple sugar transport system substrate-binding protein